MKLGTGSLVNNLKSDQGPNAPEPKVDMGATILMYSDRHAATIVALSRFKNGKLKSIIVRTDKSTIVKGSGQDGSAQYEFEYDDDGSDSEFFATKDGRWKAKGGGAFLSIGSRDTYYDPSF